MFRFGVATENTKCNGGTTKAEVPKLAKMQYGHYGQLTNECKMRNCGKSVEGFVIQGPTSNKHETVKELDKSGESVQEGKFSLTKKPKRTETVRTLSTVMMLKLSFH